MKKVKYTGVRRQGTLRPRRMWSPGEVLEVENEVAKDLVKAPGFEVVKKRRTRSKKDEEQVQEEEPPLQQEEAAPVPAIEVEEEE
jgi:hypothetical protein